MWKQITQTTTKVIINNHSDNTKTMWNSFLTQGPPGEKNCITEHPGQGRWLDSARKGKGKWDPHGRHWMITGLVLSGPHHHTRQRTCYILITRRNGDLKSQDLNPTHSTSVLFTRQDTLVPRGLKTGLYSIWTQSLNKNSEALNWSVLLVKLTIFCLEDDLI